MEMNGWKLRVSFHPWKRKFSSSKTDHFFRFPGLNLQICIYYLERIDGAKPLPLVLVDHDPENVGPSNLSRNGVKELERLDVKPQIDSFHPDFMLIVLELERFLLGGHFFLMCEFQHEDLGPAISDSNVPYEK